MSKTYNGHKNYNYWNVSLWLGNDEYLYHLVCDLLRKYRNKDVVSHLLVDSYLPSQTNDNVKYTYSNVRAALVGW